MTRYLRSLCLAGFVLAAACSAQAGSYEDFLKALHSDDVATLRTLSQRGFDLNSHDDADTPPLLIALKADALRVAEFLIQQPGVDLDAVNKADENALMLAALHGHKHLVELMLERDAEVNKPGWTPLHYAATFTGPQSPEIVALLLDHAAYIDAESPNGSTPLMMAARYGNPKSVTVLLDGGADPSLRNTKGLSAIDFANGVSRTDVAEAIAAAIRAKAPKGTW